MVRGPDSPRARWSEGPIVRGPDGPRARYTCSLIPKQRLKMFMVLDWVTSGISQDLLSGVPGGFPRGSPAFTHLLICHVSMSEIILTGALN